MTDTGQVPGEGLPENAGMVEQPGVSAPGAYTFLDPSENPAEDDDLLLMPGAQGAWGNEVAPPPPQPLVEEQPLVHEPGPHETAVAGTAVRSTSVASAYPAPRPPRSRRRRAVRCTSGRRLRTAPRARCARSPTAAPPPRPWPPR